MDLKEFLDDFESRIQQSLFTILSSHELIDSLLAESPDIDDAWEKIASSYIKDAVREVADYPTVALGWAMYLGMAVSHFWDVDWEEYQKKDNLYHYLRDMHGFDLMDEVVRGEVLGLEGDAFYQMEKIVQSCAANVWSTIQHSQIEPQSPAAFHTFAISVKVLYRVGAAMELKRLGYRMTQA